MIEVVLNDRLGKKIRVKCNEDDTIGDLKKLVAAQTGTRPEKIRIQKWYNVYKDHITLEVGNEPVMSILSPCVPNSSLNAPSNTDSIFCFAGLRDSRRHGSRALLQLDTTLAERGESSEPQPQLSSSNL